MKISILGTEYNIEQKKVEDDVMLETKAGYCDSTTKNIVVCFLKPELGSSVNIVPEEKRILRHEIIHAFLYESGLDSNSDWGSDETLVDWIALQFPKMMKAFESAGCL